MRCVRCGGRISEKTGICDFCNLKSKSYEEKINIHMDKTDVKEPRYSLKSAYILSVACSLAIIFVAFMPWGRIIYQDYVAEGNVWQMSRIIGNTYYDIPVESSVSLLVGVSAWTVGMNMIYVIRSLLGGVYNPKSRRGALIDTSLFVGIIGLIVSWGCCLLAADIFFRWWFYVELILMILNKFIFVRMYNEKYYFLRKNDVDI